jgi:hypothetical protein
MDVYRISCATWVEECGLMRMYEATSGKCFAKSVLHVSTCKMGLLTAMTAQCKWTTSSLPSKGSAILAVEEKWVNFTEAHNKSRAGGGAV